MGVCKITMVKKVTYIRTSCINFEATQFVAEARGLIKVVFFDQGAKDGTCTQETASSGHSK